MGFADIFIAAFGMEMYGCSFFMKNSQEWLSLPSREYTDSEGIKKYAPIVRFKDKAKGDEFGKLVIEAIRDWELQQAGAKKEEDDDNNFLPF